MLKVTSFSLQLRDPDGKLLSTESTLLYGKLELKEGQVLSVRSFVRVNSWPQVEVTVPCTVTGTNATCEIKFEGPESVGFPFSVTTVGTDPAEIIRLHEYCYGLLVQHYQIVCGRPVLFTDNPLLKIVVKVLNKLIPNKPIQIVLSN